MLRTLPHLDVAYNGFHDAHVIHDILDAVDDAHAAADDAAKLVYSRNPKREIFLLTCISHMAKIWKYLIIDGKPYTKIFFFIEMEMEHRRLQPEFLC